MLAVLDLHPMLRRAALVRAVAAFGNHSSESNNVRYFRERTLVSGSGKSPHWAQTQTFNNHNIRDVLELRLAPRDNPHGAVSRSGMTTGIEVQPA